MRRRSCRRQKQVRNLTLKMKMQFRFFKFLLGICKKIILVLIFTIEFFHNCPICRSICAVNAECHTCTMVEVIQVCWVCRYKYLWNNQLKVGKYQQTNIEISTSIMLTGKLSLIYRYSYKAEIIICGVIKVTSITLDKVHKFYTLAYMACFVS